jgi:hypothetical protein
MPRATDSPVADPADERLASEGPLDPEAGRAAFLVALEAGEPWYPALLDVVARWTAAGEEVDGIPHTYLIAGEAFDWLRLAEQLIETAGPLVPRDEAERLLFRGEPPDGGDELSFARAIGAQKHRAHLNFQYGVVVEEALLLAAELELTKARPVNGAREAPADVQAYERVYGKPLAELQQLYRADTGCHLDDRVRQSDWQAFTYWCSKYRFKMGEPARVASDTRKALALLSRMQAERPRPSLAVPEDADVIEAFATS